MDLVSIDISGDYPIVRWTGVVDLIPRSSVIICKRSAYILTIACTPTLRHTRQQKLIRLRELERGTACLLEHCIVCGECDMLYAYGTGQWRMFACAECRQQSYNIPSHGTEDIFVMPNGQCMYKQLIRVVGLYTPDND